MNPEVYKSNLTEKEKHQIKKELLALGTALMDQQINHGAKIYVYNKNDVLYGWYCPESHKGTRNCQYYYTHQDMNDPKCQGVTSVTMEPFEAMWHFEKACKYAPTIKEQREHYKITLVAAANHLMMDPEVLKKWESGKGVPCYHLERYIMEQLHMMNLRQLFGQA